MRVLLLFSGGLDSMTLAHMAHSEGHDLGLLRLNYFHPANNKEAGAVIAWKESNREKWRDAWEVTLPIWSLELDAGVGASGPRIVPSRNAAFVAMAINLAAAHGFNEVWIGATKADRHYPDCTPEWIAAQSDMAAAFGVRVVAPLIDLDRAEVLNLARKLDVDLALAWSCYQPNNGNPCGKCDSCLQLVEASESR